MAITKDNIPSIQNRALLVCLNVRQWDARRIDRNETDAVTTKHNAAKRAVRVHKSLLPGAASLDAIHKASGDIRSFVYKHTLPWAEGMQILRTIGYMQFTQDLQVLTSKWENLVADFVREYPSLVQQAKNCLGTLYDPDDYPDAGSIRDKFKIETKYMPVPDASDWRVDLGDEHIAVLQQNVEEQVKAAQKAAMGEAWDRLMKVVERARERLSKPDAIFRDSLIENAVELCEILPSLNITNDQNLEKMRKTIQNSLCAHDPKTLRKQPAVRAKAAKDLDVVMRKMSAMYGSFNAS